MTEFERDLFHLRNYYDLLMQLLEIHFGRGYTITTSNETNRMYLELCIKIDEILSKPELQMLSYDWKPFENLLSVDQDYPEGDWEYGGRQRCGDYRSRIEEIFIKNGSKTFELGQSESNFIVRTTKFLQNYRKKKLDDDKLFLESVEKMKPNFFQNPIHESKTIDIPRRDFKGIMEIFISHKFVESDQKLALTLRDLLHASNLSGYMAESTKQYEVLIGDKIRNQIRKSDYIIAILTSISEKSSSVNQEIGYALGYGIPVLILIEKNVPHGVLTHGRETEEFSPDNYEECCKQLIVYILENGKKKRTSDEDKKLLIENVYRPCYNSLMNAFRQKNFIITIPDDKWGSLEAYWQKKTEEDIKPLFEQYAEQIEQWGIIFRDWEQFFTYHLGELVELIKPAFERADLLKSDSIVLSESESMQVIHWLNKFRYVLIDPNIKNASELHAKLKGFAMLTKDAHAQWLDRFSAETDLFRYMMTCLPDLRNAIDTKTTYEQIVEEHQKLKLIIEKLTSALEEKLK